MCVAPEESEFDGSLLRLWKLLDCAYNGLTPDIEPGGLGGVSRLIYRVIRALIIVARKVRFLGAALPAAHFVQRELVSDTQKPAQKTATGRVKGCRVAPESHKDFLGQFFGGFRVAHNTQRQRVHRLPIAIIELFQRN